MRYKTISKYALIGLASGVLSCEQKPQQAEQGPPSALEIKTVEDSKYVFERTNIESEINRITLDSDSIAVTCGDLDGDGDLEIIVACPSRIFIYENKTPQKTAERTEDNSS